jgi:hypothetical protein
MENFWENEIHLREIPLATSHIKKYQKLDDLLSMLLLVKDNLFDGVKNHVLVLSNALWHTINYSFQAIVESFDILRTAVGTISSDA